MRITTNKNERPQAKGRIRNKRWISSCHYISMEFAEVLSYVQVSKPPSDDVVVSPDGFPLTRACVGVVPGSKGKKGKTEKDQTLSFPLKFLCLFLEVY